jgi:hypothetical protein
MQAATPDRVIAAAAAAAAGHLPPVVMKLDVEGDEYTWGHLLSVLLELNLVLPVLQCLYCSACTARRRLPVVMKLNVEGKE